MDRGSASSTGYRGPDEDLPSADTICLSGAGDAEGREGEGEGEGGGITRSSVKAVRQLKLLTSCEEGVKDVIFWLALLLQRHSSGAPPALLRLLPLSPPQAPRAGGWLAAAAASERLFVAGGGGRLCVPAGFGLLGKVNEARKVAGACRAWGRRIIVRDGWPPPQLPVAGNTVCGVCAVAFSQLWVHRGVCVECESGLRARGLCPFDPKCRVVPRVDPLASGAGEGEGREGRERGREGEGGGPGRRGIERVPFCQHQRKCVKCEEVSCMECRVHHLDGLGVAGLVKSLHPTHLFLDFDQTLCNSKSGYAPVIGKHSLNPHLADMLLARAPASADGEGQGGKKEGGRAPESGGGRACGEKGMRSQVVTRNSNRDALVAFLRSRGFAAFSSSGVGGQAGEGDPRGRDVREAERAGGGGRGEKEERLALEAGRVREKGCAGAAGHGLALEVRCVKIEACSKAHVVLASLSQYSALSQARGGGFREGALVGGEGAEGGDGWGGAGGSGVDGGGQESGGRCVGIMIDDSMLELFGDARLESCSNLHRVLFSFRDFDQ
jgi:hypothetical protein